jgi:hypothetical protein
MDNQDDDSGMVTVLNDFELGIISLIEDSNHKADLEKAAEHERKG